MAEYSRRQILGVLGAAGLGGALASSRVYSQEDNAQAASLLNKKELDDYVEKRAVGISNIYGHEGVKKLGFDRELEKALYKAAQNLTFRRNFWNPDPQVVQGAYEEVKDTYSKLQKGGESVREDVVSALQQSGFRFKALEGFQIASSNIDPVQRVGSLEGKLSGLVIPFMGSLGLNYSNTQAREAAYEGLQDGYQALNSRREMIKKGALGAAALAFLINLTGCGGGGPTSPSNGGNGNPPTNAASGTVEGGVTTLERIAINGTIQFLNRNNAVLGEATVANGVYRATVKNPGEVTRVRVTNTVDGLNTEINNHVALGETNTGVNYRILHRHPEFDGDPSFYDKVIRKAPVRAPEGNRRAVQDLTIFLDTKSYYAPISTVSEDMLRRSEEIIKNELYTPVTGLPFIEGRTVQRTNNPPARGNGNVIVLYGNRYYGSPDFDGHKGIGGEAGVPIIGSMGAFKAEVATVLGLYGEDNSFPSIVNDPPTGSGLTVTDTRLGNGQRFEALGTKKVNTIESFEPMI